MAVNRCAANIFDPPKQFLAAISADDVAEKPAQITDVFVLAEALRPCFRHPALCMLRIKCSATSCKRSEEHTSELQSLMRTSYAVFCLKKKNNNTKSNYD